MTSLNPDPFIVAPVQAADALPICLFSLPAGVLADIFDKRKSRRRLGRNFRRFGHPEPVERVAAHNTKLSRCSSKQTSLKATGMCRSVPEADIVRLSFKCARRLQPAASKSLRA
jgi:hypothetical protein